MKKIIASIVVVFALWVAYSAWPFFALYDFVRAAQAADVAKIEQRVDFPELRRSLSSQIIRAYARLKKYGEEVQLNNDSVPPCNWDLHQTSAWINYYLGKDHTSKRQGSSSSGE